MDVARVYAQLMTSVLLPALLSARNRAFRHHPGPAPREVAEALARLEPAGAAAARRGRSTPRSPRSCGTRGTSC